jgi:alkylhydroperoxidase family enzyme
MSDLITRLSLDQMPERLANMLRPRVERLGYLGEFFQCAANQPDALICFQDFTEALKAALPDQLTELVALTVAQLMDNDYERTQHERLSLKLGFGEVWVRNVLSLGETVNGLPEQEAAVQQLVIAVVNRRGTRTRVELEQVARLVGQEKTVAILLLIGRYVTHSLFVNTLQLAPPVPPPTPRSFST